MVEDERQCSIFNTECFTECIIQIDAGFFCAPVHECGRRVSVCVFRLFFFFACVLRCLFEITLVSVMSKVFEKNTKDLNSLKE